MYRIRLLLFITITWIFFVINIESVFASTTLSFLNISPLVYVLTVGIFITFLALPKASKLIYALIGSGAIFVGTIVTIFLAPMNMSVELILINVLLEMVVLATSTTIAYHLSQWFTDYNAGLKDSIFRPVETVVESVFSDVEKIERKISRARRFEHELSLISINLSNKIKNGVDKDQLNTYLAETLQIIENPGTINAWQEDTVLICVPANAQSEQVSDLIRNLSYVVKDVLGAGNELSVASFPRDGLVLSDLLHNVSVADKRQQPASVPEKHVFYTLKPKLQTPELAS